MLDTAPDTSKHPQVLVVGGGISGVSAALELTKHGISVVLVERLASLGGSVSRLHKYFPKCTALPAGRRSICGGRRPARTCVFDYHVPFGGRKHSSHGPRKQGPAAIEFYTTTKTAYTCAGAPE